MTKMMIQKLWYGKEKLELIFLNFLNLGFVLLVTIYLEYQVGPRNKPNISFLVNYYLVKKKLFIHCASLVSRSLYSCLRILYTVSNTIGNRKDRDITVDIIMADDGVRKSIKATQPKKDGSTFPGSF